MRIPKWLPWSDCSLLISLVNQPANHAKLWPSSIEIKAFRFARENCLSFTLKYIGFCSSLAVIMDLVLMVLKITLKVHTI